MPDHLTTTEIAADVGVAAVTVRYHCAKGHLAGAVKHGRDWLVPARYCDPAVYRAAVGKPGRKPGAKE